MNLALHSTQDLSRRLLSNVCLPDASLSQGSGASSSLRIFLPISVRDVVYFVIGEEKRVAQKKESRREVSAWFEATGCESFASREVTSMSGEERKKVACQHGSDVVVSLRDIPIVTS